MHTLSSKPVVSEHIFACKKLMNTDYKLKLLLYYILGDHEILISFICFTGFCISVTEAALCHSI